jgi:poly(hydroxyalkanoate) depolymerase family esterase
MNPVFQNLIAQATRLTQGGDLLAATSVIQAALRGATSPAATPDTPGSFDAYVIDVDAHEVHLARPEIYDATEPAKSHDHGPDGQFITGSFTNAAGTRAYKLYIPPAASSTNEALPLVVMLHGCTQDPDDFALGTGMNEVARKRGFYVLYPAQTQHANSSRCWNWFKHNHQARGRGEPDLLAGMALDVMGHYAIDRRRVYVAGLSAGGAMAAILGDTYPDLFAAVGVHSGLPTGSATNVQGALSVMRSGAKPTTQMSASPPTIVFHGDKDATVHPANGNHVVAASAGAAQAERQQARSSNGRHYTRHVYKDASGQTVAEHWTVHGAGHAWSGGSARGSYTDARGPNASEEMLRFFLLKTLPIAH